MGETKSASQSGRVDDLLVRPSRAQFVNQPSHLRNSPGWQMYNNTPTFKHINGFSVARRIKVVFRIFLLRCHVLTVVSMR